MFAVQPARKEQQHVTAPMHGRNGRCRSSSRLLDRLVDGACCSRRRPSVPPLPAASRTGASLVTMAPLAADAVSKSLDFLEKLTKAYDAGRTGGSDATGALHPGLLKHCKARLPPAAFPLGMSPPGAAGCRQWCVIHVVGPATPDRRLRCLLPSCWP